MKPQVPRLQSSPSHRGRANVDKKAPQRAVLVAEARFAQLRGEDRRVSTAFDEAEGEVCRAAELVAP
eukprot:11223655-Lingulodinium_polyedra.AAC.1